METQKKPAISRKKASAPPPPPPPLWTPSAARRPIKVRSSTRDEIDRYWRMRRMIEEDHLLFAQKAAARIRTMALKEEDHRRFEELLKKMSEEEQPSGGGNKELRIGIKDWWTRSKYAYLNQPTIVSTGENAAPKRPTLLPLPGPGALLCHIIRSSLDARAQMLVAETDARP
ncbi:hypothetical protein OPV22_002445 [Ensete ventricosum]|uniref:Uncharacterized protein n=1 Tax=Ensete ventricosum TaxID=4639 RepID=A0AAV8RXX1_ENSVE|nr:hypothetical protein OPV22_002445 [Ensete ventricosum]